MASYKLTFKKPVAKDLQPIPKRDLTRILKRIETLTQDPQPEGCEKLSGQERYRVRHGVYRIICEIFDRELVVMVVKVDHRCHVYAKGRQSHPITRNWMPAFAGTACLSRDFLYFKAIAW